MIEIEGLNKTFKLFQRPSDRLLEAITGKNRHATYQALRDISFRVAPGEVLGVLGRNGAGKSTLLKLLTGVLVPDSGAIHIDGRVTGLLELGTGFNTELTGRQNIIANALMLGMTHAEVDERRDEIIAFSELGSYIDEPLRTYSSGMVMRLGFSIAIHADPRCFLVDEALSVGDGYFQQKCMKRIREFQDSGGSIIFVSHDLNAVKILCDRVMVLDEGRIVFDGEAERAVNHYNRIMARQAEEEEGRHLARTHSAYGTREVEVLNGRVRGQESASDAISSGEVLDIELELMAHQSLDNITLGIMVRDRFGRDIFGVNSHQLGRALRVEPGAPQLARLSLQADIAPGKYTVTIALHSREHHLDQCYWWCDSYLQFEVAGFRGHLFSGACRLPLTLDLLPVEAANSPASSGEHAQLEHTQ